jgi:hypothetical protein
MKRNHADFRKNNTYNKNQNEKASLKKEKPKL